MADSPLTLAEVTGFMAMEVKLQSSLTEQNAKFIKVCLLFCYTLRIIRQTGGNTGKCEQLRAN